MAKLKGDILFTGTMGDITAYKRQDIDGIIVQQKGGPTKEQVRKSPKFDMVRRNNSEFSGRATATRWLRRITQPLHRSGDTRFTSRLNSLMKVIQVKDTVIDLGQRGIPFSGFPKLLEGFNLNQYHSFDAIIRNPLSVDLSKDELKATIQLPALLPGSNFISPYNHPFFQVTVVFGLLPDLVYTPYGYKPLNYEADYPVMQSVSTEWQPTLKGMEAKEIVLQLPADKAPANYTMVLSAGLGFGKVTDIDNGIEQVKYAGAAKIVGMD